MFHPKKYFQAQKMKWKTTLFNINRIPFQTRLKSLLIGIRNKNIEFEYNKVIIDKSNWNKEYFNFQN